MNPIDSILSNSWWEGSYARQAQDLLRKFEIFTAWREPSIKDIQNFLWSHTGRVIHNVRSATAIILLMYIELLEEKKHEIQLDSEVRRLRDESNVINNFEWVIETDLEGNILSVNDLLILKTWFSREDLIGKNMRVMSSWTHSKVFWKTFWTTILSGEPWEGDICNKKKDWSYIWFWTLIVPMKNEYGVVYNFKVFRQDVSEWYDLKKRLRNKKKIDLLTWLPNRMKCHEDFVVDKTRSAVIIHVNRMYSINYAYWKDVGDKTIQEIGKILEKYIADYGRRYHVRLYKFDGTDFCLIYSAPVSESHIQEQVLLLQNLSIQVNQDNISQGEKIDTENSSMNRKIPISFSVWSAFNQKEINTLLSYAYLALRESRTSSQPHISFQDDIYAIKKSRDYFDILDLSREALKRRDIFRVYLQEIIRNSERKEGEKLSPRKFEALIRMRDPITWSIHSPGDFLSSIELDGKSQNLTSYVIRDTCEFMIQNDVHVSINLSKDDLRTAGRAHSIYKEILEYSIDPCRITFEILENIELLDAITLDNIKILKNYGFSIAIDDYWVSYSGIARIPEIKPNYLKIDMSIIRGIDTDKNKQVMVKSIIVLAQGFWMEVIAEGVEKKEEQLILAALSVDASQGYLFSKPLDMKEIVL